MSQQLILTIITTVVTAVILPLITLVGNKLIAWLGVKLKHEKLASYTIQATTVVTNAVKAITQTYVDSLKKSGAFDQTAQQTALDMCKNLVNNQLSADVKTYLSSVYGEYEAWITAQIESSIHTLKLAQSLIKP